MRWRARSPRSPVRGAATCQSRALCVTTSPSTHRRPSRRAVCSAPIARSADGPSRRGRRGSQQGFLGLTPHDARHSYASLMIAAGVNAKALSTFMGHANIAITLDLYGHLMPGSEAQAADLLDAYLTLEATVAPTVARPLQAAA